MNMDAEKALTGSAAYMFQLPSHIGRRFPTLITKMIMDKIIKDINSRYDISQVFPNTRFCF